MKWRWSQPLLLLLLLVILSIVAVAIAATTPRFNNNNNDDDVCNAACMRERQMADMSSIEWSFRSQRPPPTPSDDNSNNNDGGGDEQDEERQELMRQLEEMKRRRAETEREIAMLTSHADVGDLLATTVTAPSPPPRQPQRLSDAESKSFAANVLPKKWLPIAGSTKQAPSVDQLPPTPTPPPKTRVITVHRDDPHASAQILRQLQKLSASGQRVSVQLHNANEGDRHLLGLQCLPSTNVYHDDIRKLLPIDGTRVCPHGTHPVDHYAPPPLRNSELDKRVVRGFVLAYLWHPYMHNEDGFVAPRAWVHRGVCMLEGMVHGEGGLVGKPRGGHSYDIGRYML